MRAVLLPALALPLVLTHCGAKGDLVIGEVALMTAGSGTQAPVAGTGGSASSPGEAGAPGANGGEASGGPADCALGDEPPLGSLVHRYDFSGTGTTLKDLVGDADGTVEAGAQLDGSGVLSLAGRTEGQPDQYVDLPNGIVSSLSEVTFVVWLSYQGGAGFQRILDFGDSTSGEGQGDSGRNYLAVLYGSNFANGDRLGAQLAAPGFPSLSLGTYFELVQDEPYQVSLAFRSNDRVALFADGQELISSPVQRSLAELNDVNCWLGRSQWTKDHPFHGKYDELRIYDVALNACQLATLRSRGPDVP
ncbi:MAG: LamG domain-containing protein [Myxococcales bacterium]|nr:MAG: LamG domain-containing protein [Myxococcales bacterium]